MPSATECKILRQNEGWRKSLRRPAVYLVSLTMLLALTFIFAVGLTVAMMELAYRA